jgi:hypothetical protein
MSTGSFVQDVRPQGVDVDFRNITTVDDTCLERDSALRGQRYGCSRLPLSTLRTIVWDYSRSLAISRKILHAPRVRAANMALYLLVFLQSFVTCIRAKRRYYAPSLVEVLLQ